MDKKNWNGILKLIELHHLDVDGSIISKQVNRLNTLHQGGEEFLLRAAFTGGRISEVIPDFYYIGLDNRQSVSFSDTIDNLIGEPITGGYQRQQVSSSGDFAINLNQTHFLATSPIVGFRSTTTGWGPVSNIFLTTAIDSTGDLISTVVLAAPISLGAGQSVTMRIGITIKDCP